MAGQIKVDSINADSNLALKIANTAVAFIDATGLRPVAGNVNLDATATSKFYLPSANTVAIQTAGVTAVTVDSSQNVTLAGTASATKLIPTGSSATGTGMYLPAADSLGFSANGTNAVYIDSSQRIGIGTSSPEANAKMTVYGGGIGISTNSTQVAPTGYDLKIRSNTSLLGIHTDNSSGVPTIEFGNGNSGYCTIKGTASVAMTFQTNSTERFRIDSGGNVLVGTTSDASLSGPAIKLVGGTNTSGNFYTFLITYSNNAQTFGLRNDGYVIATAIYSLTTASGANVNVDTQGFMQRSTSALKYKQDIRDLESIDITKFRPVRYKSKCANDDQELDHFGIVADEVDAAGIKELVSYGLTGDVEGFQYERLTVVLVKAMQEQQALITAQAATIAALTARMVAVESK